jgi:hypothetical protein
MRFFTTIAVSSALMIGGMSSAHAQAGSPPMASPDAPHNPAIKSADDGGPGPLAAGHNSFTEAQARGRIQKAGYTDVTGLALSDDGLWQGHAMMNGKPVAVSMDFRGHVSAQ